MTHTVDEARPADAARAALAIAQGNYRRATIKHQKIDATIEAAEKRLATATNDLEGYKNLDADVGTASAKLLLKGGDLKLGAAIAKQIADRDALRNEIKILQDGLGALGEQIKEVYAHKRTCYIALDDAAAAILRADSDTLATRLATILEEARVIAQRLRAYQSAGVFPREQQDIHIGARPCISAFGNQMLATVASPLHLDSVGEGSRTKTLVEWHTKLIRNPDAELPEGAENGESRTKQGS
jgi:hypothetical protein